MRKASQDRKKIKNRIGQLGRGLFYFANDCFLNIIYVLVELNIVWHSGLNPLIFQHAFKCIVMLKSFR